MLIPYIYIYIYIYFFFFFFWFKYIKRDLDNNNLDGNIPSSIGNLTQLKEL